MNLPGYTAGTTYTPRDFLASTKWVLELPGGVVLDSANGNDGAHTYTYDIREGWLVGKITATGLVVPCKRSRANGAGVSTTALIVDNAAAFKAGDTITIDSALATVISSISSNTITLATARSWNDNAAIAANDGSQTCIGILGSFARLRNDENTAAQNKPGVLVIGGLVQSAKLLGDWDAIFSDASSVKNLKLIALDTSSPLASGTFDSLAVTGDIAAGSITGADSVFDIKGLAGSTSAGGSVPIVGGAGDGSNNVGGLVSLTGGASAGSGIGGAASLVGGRGGPTGAGGAVSVTSGAGGSTSGLSGALTLATGTTTADSTSATGALSVTSGAGCTGATSTNGGASGAVTVQSGAGGTTGTGTAGASGAVTLKSAAGGAATGAGTGGASGAVAIQSGNGGATTTSTAGKANSITLTGGNGGAASGAGTGGQGASIIFQAGTGGTTSGGTAGIDGMVMARGLTVGRKTTVTAMTTTATVTAAAMLGGLITANQGAAGAATYTLPTGTVLQAALPTDIATGDSFDFSICNLSTNAAEDVTVAGDTGMTAKGNMVVAANSGVGEIAAGTFRVVKTGNNTFDFYRIG